MGFHYFLQPAPGQSWGLSIERVSRAIRERWPDASVVPETSPAGPSLYFQLREGGQPRVGTYYPPPGEQVTLEDHDIDVVPRIFAWFVGIAPDKVPSLTFSGVAPDPLPVPAEDAEQALGTIYNR